jgi:MraZ protein
MDGKGRMAFPTRYRERLMEQCDGNLVITIDTEERCLLIYPLPEWEVIEKKIEALPSFNRAARRIQRLLIGHATDLELDGSGRVLLPAPLREYAGLDKKLMLIGQGKKFELWSEEHWDRCRDDYLDEGSDADALPEEMMNLSL